MSSFWGLARDFRGRLFLSLDGNLRTNVLFYENPFLRQNGGDSRKISPSIFSVLSKNELNRGFWRGILANRVKYP
jgi:hypothetical protein